jgi:hypothetical protein
MLHTRQSREVADECDLRCDRNSLQSTLTPPLLLLLTSSCPYLILFNFSSFVSLLSPFSALFHFFILVMLSMPIPVVARSKAWFCGRSLAGIVGSNPAGGRTFVCCECCVLSGRGLYDELITRPEESNPLSCVGLCGLKTSSMRRP